MYKIALKKTLKEKGFPVAMHGEYCKRYLSTHPNCTGCEMIEGCGRFTSLLLTYIAANRNNTSQVELDKTLELIYNPDIKIGELKKLVFERTKLK